MHIVSSCRLNKTDQQDTALKKSCKEKYCISSNSVFALDKNRLVSFRINFKKIKEVFIKVVSPITLWTYVCHER